MECNKCNNTMDEESEEFCKEYGISTCLTCCGKEIKEGKMYHLSIPVYSHKI